MEKFLISLDVKFQLDDEKKENRKIVFIRCEKLKKTFRKIRKSQNFLRATLFLTLIFMKL